MVAGDPPHAAPAEQAGGRLSFLDVGRGLAVVGMVIANLANVMLVERPRWLGHNLGNELLPLDLPAPLFQFLIGVSLALFLARRSGGPGRAARLLALRRFVVLIVLGAVLDGVAAGRLEFRWGVLQTLGTGGVVATALAGLPDAAVLGVAALITAAHLGPANNEVHRGLFDCLPFLPLSLLGYVLGRPLAAGDRRTFIRRSAVAALACLALALGLNLAGIPYNKVVGTSSFVAFAGGMAALLVGALAQAEAIGVRLPEPLVALGANALMVWVLQYLLVYYPLGLFGGGPPPLGAGAGLALVAFTTVTLCVLAVRLGRRGVRIPI